MMLSRTLCGFILVLLLGATAPVGAQHSGSYVQDLQDSLVAFAASDFSVHGPRSDGFRNVDMRYRENDHGARSYMLCGQFRASAEPGADWADFATIKTDPYEQWIGGSAADMCVRATRISPDGDDLSSELQTALRGNASSADRP